jgi:hypothetical protein
MVNMAFSTLPNVAEGGLIIVVHPRTAPSDQEWEAYLAEYIKYDPEKLLTLVLTDGGGPSAGQRKAVNDMLQGRTTRAAVVTKSPIVRGVVSALGWFNPKIKTFPPTNVDGALKYLGLQPAEFAHVRFQLKLLREKFGATPVESLAAACVAVGV